VELFLVSSEPKVDVEDVLQREVRTVCCHLSTLAVFLVFETPDLSFEVLSLI
jgi:hypothetical protein